jgi:hypothetical protein
MALILKYKAMMKYLFLFISILSAITPAYAQNRPGSVITMDERPLSNAIRGALKNRPVEAKDIQFLIDQGIKEFNLRDFAHLASNERPLDKSQVGMQAYLQAPNGQRSNIRNPGRNITIEVVDGKGQTVKLQTVFSYNKEGSPEAMYDAHAVNATKRPNAREMMHNLPMESMVFYYGLGLANILSLVTESYNDPKVFDRYLKSLVDPVAQASFVAFIVANRAGSFAMNSLLYSAVLSKTMSPKAKQRISTMLIPHLGMAVGGMASNVMHDLVSIVKPCSGAMMNPDTTLEERKALCDQAYKNVFSSDNAYKYATSALSMVSAGFIMMYGQAFINFVKAAGGRLTYTRAVVQMTLSTVAMMLPIPQTKLIIAFKHATKGAIHLVIFLKLDEWFVHPFWHHVVERYFQVGPKFQAFQEEMIERLQKTNVTSKIEQIHRPANEAARLQLEQLAKESIERSGDVRNLFVKPTPANIPTTSITTRVFDIKFGNEPALPVMTDVQKALAVINTFKFVIPGFPATDWMMSDSNKFNQKMMGFSDLLEKHFEVSDRWRQSLMGKITRQYQNHLEMIAPFNAKSQMTFELYNDFFEQAANIHSTDAAKSAYAKESLFEDNTLFGIKPRDLNGNVIDTSDYIFSSSLEEGETLNRKQQLQLNTARLSVCWIDQFLTNILTKKKNDMLTQHFQAIKNNLNQFPEDIVCEGHTGTLKRQRSDLDMTKIRNGLTNLAWIMQRFSSGLNNQFFSHRVAVSDGQGGDSVYVRINYMENISYFLGGYLTLERGEAFLGGWDKSFKETQPDFYKKLNPYSPAANIFRLMGCQTVKKPIVGYDTVDWWFGNIHFNPPSVVSKVDSRLCSQAFDGGLMSPAKENMGYIMNNPKLGEYIDHIIANADPEIFGEAPSSMVSFANSLTNWFDNPLLRDTKANEFVIKYRNQMLAGPNRFINWWDSKVETEIAKIFATINVNYEKGLQKNIADKITGFNGDINISSVPNTLTLSYLGQMKIYMDFILKIYASLQQDRSQVAKATELRDEILASVKNELDLSIQTSRDKNDITRAHAQSLALLKKFKGLVQSNAFRSTSPYIQGDSEESVKFREASVYFNEKLGYGNNPHIIHREWLNELDFRAINDKYVNQAFRESIEVVGKNYESLKPVYLSEHFRGNGIQPVKELFNYITTLSGEVYKLTKMTRLTTDSNYKEMDDKGQERRGRGSRKAF